MGSEKIHEFQNFLICCFEYAIVVLNDNSIYTISRHEEFHSIETVHFSILNTKLFLNLSSCYYDTCLCIQIAHVKTRKLTKSG